MTRIDREHGKVVETKVTETMWIFIHEDGYKEIIFDDEMEVQPIQYADRWMK